MAATFALRDARVAELSDEGMSEWAALADRALEPNPFNDPRFLVPAARTLPEAAELRVLFVTRGEQLVGAWAFTREKKYAGIPIPHLSTGGTFMVGTVPWRHPVIDPDDGVATLAAMLEGLAGVGLPGLIDMQHIPADGAFAEALAEAIRRVDGGVRVLSRARLPLAARDEQRDAAAARPQVSLLIADRRTVPRMVVTVTRMVRQGRRRSRTL